MPIHSLGTPKQGELINPSSGIHHAGGGGHHETSARLLRTTKSDAAPSTKSVSVPCGGLEKHREKIVPAPSTSVAGRIVTRVPLPDIASHILDSAHRDPFWVASNFRCAGLFGPGTARVSARVRWCRIAPRKSSGTSIASSPLPLNFSRKTFPCPPAERGRLALRHAGNGMKIPATNLPVAVIPRPRN
jgi:hypothetical protein